MGILAHTYNKERLLGCKGGCVTNRRGDAARHKMDKSLEARRLQTSRP